MILQLRRQLHGRPVVIVQLQEIGRVLVTIQAVLILSLIALAAKWFTRKVPDLNQSLWIVVSRNRMKILITGATGLIGQKLISFLGSQGHHVVAVVRDKKHITELPAEDVFQWDAIEDPDFPLKALGGCEAVIHLAGYPVAQKRWSSEVKKKILSSRVRGTRQLVQAFSKLNPAERPKVFLSASAIGFYGDRSEETLTENSPPGEDFLADVVTEWEQEALKAKKLEIRTVLLRTGIVLSQEGGALKKMPPVILGAGKNYMSWIHISDWVRLALYILQNEKGQGAFNVVSPEPVRQSDFARALAKAKKLPSALWTPQILLKWGAGQMSEMILASQKVYPEKALQMGFQFQFKQLNSALKDIYR